MAMIESEITIIFVENKFVIYLDVEPEKKKLHLSGKNVVIWLTKYCIWVMKVLHLLNQCNT